MKWSLAVPGEISVGQWIENVFQSVTLKFISKLHRGWAVCSWLHGLTSENLSLSTESLRIPAPKRMLWTKKGNKWPDTVYSIVYSRQCILYCYFLLLEKLLLLARPIFTTAIECRGKLGYKIIPPFTHITFWAQETSHRGFWPFFLYL